MTSQGGQICTFLVGPRLKSIVLVQCTSVPNLVLLAQCAQSHLFLTRSFYTIKPFLTNKKWESCGSECINTKKGLGSPGLGCLKLTVHTLELHTTQNTTSFASSRTACKNEINTAWPGLATGSDPQDAQELKCIEYDTPGSCGSVGVPHWNPTHSCFIDSF